jgi:hypothetical protein
MGAWTVIQLCRITYDIMGTSNKNIWNINLNNTKYALQEVNFVKFEFDLSSVNVDIPV